eukprot:scaffold62029_cov65-Attheya_sp.AAC.6
MVLVQPGRWPNRVRALSVSVFDFYLAVLANSDSLASLPRVPSRCANVILRASVIGPVGGGDSPGGGLMAAPGTPLGPNTRTW